MALTDYQIDWIGKAAGKEIDLDAFAAKEKARNDKLALYVGPESDLAASRDSISKAQEFTIKKGKGAIKWRATDSDRNGYELRADVEFDTVNDTRDATEAVPRHIIDDAHAAVMQLNAISERMANEYDEEGNRIFSDDDIRREVWTPMVRDGTIPDNIVPKQFSEHAIAFKGAMEIYQARIDKHSQSSTGKEDLIRGLGIAADTASLIGTLATSSVTISGATTKADINKELLTSESPRTEELKEQKALIEQRENFTKLGAAIVTGGFSVTQAVVKETAKEKEERDWAKVADTSIKVLTKVVAAGIGPIAKEIVGVDKATNDDDGKAKMRTAEAVKAGVLGGLSALRLAPTLANVVKADPKDRRKLVEQMIEQVADAVQYGFVAAASKSSDTEEQAKLREMGAYIRTIIVVTGKAERACELLAQGKPGEAAMLLGAAALQDGMAIASTFAVDAMKKNVDSDTYKNASTEERLFMEKTDTDKNLGKTELARSKAMEKLLKTVEEKTNSVTEDALKIYQDGQPVEIDAGAEEAAKAAEEQIEKQQVELAQKKLEEQFGDEAFVKDMFEDFETKMVGYDDIYKDANPTKLVEGKPDEVADALAAIDRAIAQTSALRARAEMINGITGGAASIVAALVPGTGAVSAAQAVAYDIYCLCQAVRIHNEWVESMKVAFRAESAYAASIEKTLENANITLSHKSVKLVLDSLKLGNEIGRCFDPTGATTVISASLTMTSALVDYGYKMQKEAEISRGWDAYKTARENPENRKAARKAMRMNSTLAKCCIAYGACMKKDPVAQEAIRISGLSPAILADDKDVCNKLVAYLENEMSDDPVVLQVERQPKKWQPGKPELTPKSWFETKTAASISAEPRLDPGSVKTPGMDRLLADLHSKSYWDGHRSYKEWRSDKAGTDDDAETRKDVATRSTALLEKLISQMDAYKPLQARSPEKHKEMADIAETYKALAQINISIAKLDLSD